MKLKKFKWNKSLLCCLILFMITSILTIYSAETYLPNYLGNLALKQLLWYVIGMIVILITIKITNKNFYRYSLYLYIFGNILLLLLLIFGTPINNSKCWFVIPGIGSFQPSEFMKVFLILIISTTAGKYLETKSKLNFKQELILIGKVFILFVIPSILTFLEPDTGVVIIYFIICISVLLASSLRKRWFIISFIILFILAGGFLYLYFYQQTMFVDIFGTNLFYRIDRLLDWKNGTGMQLENSLTAIGSSGLFGHGFNKTPIYFPESGTDFIFAVFSSNFGLIGSLILVSLIIYFDLSLIKLAKKAKNLTDKFIVISITSMLAFQQFQNISMTLGIMPITGITLPFISYGGSSLLSYMFVLGILFNVYHDNYKTINN